MPGLASLALDRSDQGSFFPADVGAGSHTDLYVEAERCSENSAAQKIPLLSLVDGVFQAAYGYVPPYQAAESTAAVVVYVDALKRANSFDTEKVREALAATNLQTFYGWVDFDETGKNIAKPMVLRQVQKGKYIPVAPSKFAAGEVIFPKPKWKDR